MLQTTGGVGALQTISVHPTWERGLNRRNDRLIGGMILVSPPCVRPSKTPISVYLLSGYWNTGVQHHTIQALHHVLAVAVDEPHPEPGQPKLLAKTPHTMSSLGVRQL